MVTDDERGIRNADKVIFPGVGHANAAMEYLRERQLDQLIKSLQQPVLGICLGLQLLCGHSEEGDTTCMGVFENEVKLFSSTDLKVPQVGWNNIYDYQSPLFTGYNRRPLCIRCTATTQPSAATLSQKRSTFHLQRSLQKVLLCGAVHPEKSGLVGETILRNFIQLIYDHHTRTRSHRRKMRTITWEIIPAKSVQQQSHRSC